MSRPEALPIPKARILVVDDEPTTRRAVARALGLSGYEAEAAASGTQALELLAARPYDLMLLDLRMPGMDGVEVMARVQERYPNLLIIVFTAHATVHSAIEAVRVGAVDYLLKPSTIHDIEAAVARALERQRERLRRQHLIQIMAEALAALQAEDALQSAAPQFAGERFLRSGPVSFDRVKRLVVVAGSDGPDDEAVPSLDAVLTEYEAVLLAFLMERPDRPFSCRELARALGYAVDEHEAQDIVRPHISRLRKKIEVDPSRPRWVRTLRGQGYLFSTAPAP